MTAKVVPLFNGASDAELGKPQPELIARLRALLAEAESGYLQGMAAACTNADSTVTTVLLTNGENFAVSHSIGALWFRFQQRMFDKAEDVG